METIGRYRIIRRIGAGSFATVHLGHDDELDVPVAIKVLAENWSDNDDVRSRFLAEARLLRRIRDEHVVSVHDIGSTPDGRPYFVMDFANAGTFADLRRSPIEAARTLELCAEAARGLEVLHRHEMIHRDVTPGNILMANTASGLRVMLADLGVAKSMVDQVGATMTAGTPSYMALEQARGEALDARCDVYSMTAVTYAVLVGRAPFPVKTLADLLERNPAIGPAPISHQLGAPAELDTLLTRGLSSDPGLRPSSAGELADELEALAARMTGRISVPSAAPTGVDSPRTSSSPIPPIPLPASGPLVHRNETPGSMLQNYLGPGRYQVEAPKERHSTGWYVTTGAALLVLAALVAWLVVSWLG